MRKGQGSVEFLMTYGWAILGLLVAMVVMWQWGVFSFGETIDPGSFGFWGINILNGNDFTFDAKGNLQFSAYNTVGANITIVYVNATVGQNTVECEPGGGDICSFVPNVDDEPNSGDESYTIPPGKIRRIALSDNTLWRGDAGSRFEMTLVMRYTDSRTGSQVYQSSGKLWGNRVGG